MDRKFRKIAALFLALCLTAPVFFAGTAEDAATDAQGFTYEPAGGGLMVTGYSGPETELVIPADSDGVPVTAIGDYAFYQNTTITSVVIPQGVTTIGEGAFLYNNSLTTVELPESLTRIGSGAFYKCPSLTGFAIPSAVTYIGEYAFYMCTSLTSVSIPAGVTEIGEAAFARNSGLSAFEVETANPVYSHSGGVLYDKAMAVLIAYPAGAQASEFVVPGSVSAIGSTAFMGSGLTAVTLPEGLKSIGASAFNQNYSLETLRLPETLEEIGDYAFNACNSLREVYIPAGVSSIGESAFETCVSLAAINVAPDNARYHSLDGVLFETGASMLHTYPAGRAPAAYDIPAGTALIGPSAFYATAVTGVTIPSGVTGIGAYAFGQCSGLTEVTIPDTVTVLEDRAFTECLNLESVIIPESVVTIGEDVFSDDAVLTISGLAGSYAEVYANQNTIPFASLGEAQVKFDTSARDIYAAFAGEQAVDLSGCVYDASAFLARPTLVNIWATWCGPCVGEIPALAKLASEYAGRLNMVGIQLDAVTDGMSLDEDALGSARKLFQSAGSTYPSLIPTASIMDLVNSMNVSGIPTTWFVGTDGRLVREIVGAHDLNGWRTEIEGFLAGQGQ